MGFAGRCTIYIYDKLSAEWVSPAAAAATAAAVAAVAVATAARAYARACFDFG